MASSSSNRAVEAGLSQSTPAQSTPAQSSPAASAHSPDLDARVTRALERAHRVLWQSQRPDGSWDTPGQVGCWTTSQVMVSLHYVGTLDAAEAEGAAKWLRAQQRADGGFTIHPYAKVGELGSTACAWAALHVSNAHGVNDEAISKARAFIDRHGGFPGVIDLMETGDSCALYLALAGLIDPKRIPCPTSAPLLIPGAMDLLETRFHSGVFILAFQTEILLRRLTGEWGTDGSQKGILGRLICDRYVDLLNTFQNPDGSWNDSVVISVQTLAALKAMGMEPHRDSMLQRALAWMKTQKVEDAQGVHYDGFGTEVWATAFNVRALLAGNVPAADVDIQRALKWLAGAQLQTPMPRVDNRQKNAPLSGGWAFQRTNHNMPDCDDAGVVLSAIGEALQRRGADAVSPELAVTLRHSVEKGRDWLLGMQNPDGGWSAFVWGLPGKKPGPILKTTPRVNMSNPLDLARVVLNPPAPMGDPSTEDLTSRVLHGLGQIGYNIRFPEVARAVEFLRVQQCESGAWWGRWVVNYLSATAFILMGLKAVQADMTAPWIRRALRWVVSKQNGDGGWGEGPESYRDEKLAGVGPSMPPLTGLVLQALIGVGEGNSDAVKRGIENLISTQRPDGTWPNGEYLHTNVPPDTFYVYPEAARFYPTEALGRFLARGTLPPPSPWNDELLNGMRKHKDPVADAVVEEIFQGNDVKAVNDLMANIFRSDEPIPKGLPPRAARYFEETAALPDWADGAKIAQAQELFTRMGWQVAASLFCSSLPQAYAAANGARVLARTGAMTRRTSQRIFETAQFLFDVLDERALLPDGRGVRAAQKVRLMHAGVRHLIATHAKPEWDANTFGEPVNQEDLAGTLMTFSVLTLDGLHKLGEEVTTSEGEAWLHTWKVIGHLMGVRPELMPANCAEGELLMEAIRDRQWAPSEEGRRLARALVQMMQGYFPGKLLDGLPIALIRHLAGDHCADLLGLPKADWTASLVLAGDALDELVSRELGGGGLSPLAAASHLLMKGVVLAEREGKQAQFRIPASLRRSLG